MYKIIGADQKEYGPVSAEELRQWIAEGRANAQSRVQAAGSPDWRTLSTFPEFAADLGRIPATPPPPLSYAAASYREPSRKTNGLAIAGFVFSLLGIPCCIGVASLFGLVFSIIALLQLRRRPQQSGRSLAIAGIFISVLTLLFWLAIVVYMANSFSQGADWMSSDQT